MKIDEGCSNYAAEEIKTWVFERKEDQVDIQT